MDNELLKAMREMIEPLAADIKNIDIRLSKLEQGQTKLEQGQAKLEQDMNERFENLDFKIIKTKVS